MTDSYETRIVRLETYQEQIITNNEKLIAEIELLRTDLKQVAVSLSALTHSVGKSVEIEKQCTKLEKELNIVAHDLERYTAEFQQCKQSIERILNDSTNNSTSIIAMTTPLKWIATVIGLALATYIGTHWKI